MGVQKILVVGETLFLLVICVLSQNECQGLNIYSTLPDHIVEWLKRHILIEISSINYTVTEDEAKSSSGYSKTCSSLNGPFCRYLNAASAVSGFDLETSNYIHDHEGGIGHFNRDFLVGKSVYNLFAISEAAAATSTSSLDGEAKVEVAVKSVSRAKLDDTLAVTRHCRLKGRTLVYCLRLILRSYYVNLSRRLADVSFLPGFVRSWKASLGLLKSIRQIKDSVMRFKRRSYARRSERRGRIYTIISDYTLPPASSDYLEKEGPMDAVGPRRRELYFQTKSNLLFDETLSLFLKSRYVRTNLVNSLTWILQQKSPYSDIWQNLRNERLSKHYIITDHPESHGCGHFSVSPYNGFKVCSDLMDGDFHSKFRVVRKAWNGVSSVMDFSGLKPNVRLLPSQFSSDERLSCDWEGLWETHQDTVLSVKLLARFGKFRVINEKIVMSRLPVSISSASLEGSHTQTLDELKTITISGYNHSKLMWKSTIPLSRFKSEDGHKKKWVNALDYSDTIPYSLINVIQFETDFLVDSASQSILVGPFEYNLLNPAFNYIPKGEERYQNLGVEIGPVAELSLVIYINHGGDKKWRNNVIPSVSMTTMYTSKASPLVSIHNIETKGLRLNGQVSENTLSVIKKNMAEITKDQ